MNNNQNETTSSNQKRILLILLLLFLTSATVFVFASSEETPIVDIILESTELSVGDQGELGISTNQENLEWTSLNTSIVTVDGDGVMTAISAGTTQITVTSSSDQSDTVTVTVNDVFDPSFTITILEEVFTYNNSISVDELEIPSKENYEFTGWFLDQALTTPLTEESIDASVTLYPGYEMIVIEPKTIELTLIDEQNTILDTYEVNQGEAFDFESLELGESFVGFYLDPTTCDSPIFDPSTLLMEDTTLTLVYNDQTSPCISLEAINVKGDLEVGETLEVFYDPFTDDVSFTWYRLEDGVYTEIPNETRKFYTITDNDVGAALKVEVTALGDINGMLSYTTEIINTAQVAIVDYDTIYETICDGFVTLDMIYPVGSGTLSNPYLITNWYQLDLLRYTYSIDGSANHFRISEDLNQSTLGYAAVASSSTDFNTGFTPIMNEPCSEDRSSPFIGFVYADNVTISDVYINLLGVDYVGLFGILNSNSELHDFTIENFNITGNNYVGTLVGEARDSLIDNATISSSTIYGEERVGGIAGRLLGSTINESTFNGTVYGRLYVGGIAGSTNVSPSDFDSNNPPSISTISQSENHGTIYGQFSVGGIVGGNGLYGFVEHVTNTGIIQYNDTYSPVTENVIGIDSYGDQFGGLIGGQSGSLEYGYSSGDVLALIDENSETTKIGGAIGAIGIGGSASNVIVEANVEGYFFVAGIVGFLGGPLENAFYKGEVTGLYDANGIFGLTINFEDFNASVNNVAVLKGSIIRAFGNASGLGYGSLIGQVSISGVSIEADIYSNDVASGLLENVDRLTIENVVLKTTLHGNNDNFFITRRIYDSLLNNVFISSSVNGELDAIVFEIRDSTMTGIYINDFGLDEAFFSIETPSEYNVNSDVEITRVNYSDMFNENTYQSFDFDNIWNIEEGLSMPWLKFLELIDYEPDIIQIP